MRRRPVIAPGTPQLRRRHRRTRQHGVARRSRPRLFKRGEVEALLTLHLLLKPSGQWALQQGMKKRSIKQEMIQPPCTIARQLSRIATYSLPATVCCR
jgi:hypothetical protein